MKTTLVLVAFLGLGTLQAQAAPVAAASSSGTVPMAVATRLNTPAAPASAAANVPRSGLPMNVATHRGLLDRTAAAEKFDQQVLLSGLSEQQAKRL